MHSLMFTMMTGQKKAEDALSTALEFSFREGLRFTANLSHKSIKQIVANSVHLIALLLLVV